MLKKKVGWYVAFGALALAVVVGIAHASAIVYNAALVNQPALAYNSAYVLDLQSAGITSLSAQAVYSSATIPSQTFQDGTQSTGSFTVLSNTTLSTATATNNLTVANNAGLAGATLVLPGVVLQQGLDWAILDVASNTASSIASALQTVPGLQVSHAAGSSVVYTTAPSYGTLYNGWAFTSSTPTALTVATAFFTGGQGRASVSLNGQVLKQGQQWQVGGSLAATATNIAAAINANSVLNKLVKAQAVGAVVTATSTLANVNAFPLKSSLPSGILASGAAMTGGTAPSYGLNGQITIPSNSFSTALPLLYTSGSLVVGGLTDQTTYYAVPLASPGVFGLASSQANALLGTYITFTSSTTQLSAQTGTLAPLPITGTPGFLWQVSNDNTNWQNLAVSSVTMSSYSTPPANTIWSFGYIGPRYLRANVTAPTTGAIQLSIGIIGTN